MTGLAQTVFPQLSSLIYVSSHKNSLWVQSRFAIYKVVDVAIQITSRITLKPTAGWPSSRATIVERKAIHVCPSLLAHDSSKKSFCGGRKKFRGTNQIEAQNLEEELPLEEANLSF